MRIARLAGLVLPLLAMPSLGRAQIDVRVEAHYDGVAPGVGVASIEVFYDRLSPYGVWVDEPRLGRVFIPDRDGYVPYRVGHWQYTNLGFVWVSNEPFGWATSHYGRWAYSPIYDRWVWVPDTEWGPAWVEWRETGDSFGWAPLPPPTVVGIYEPPISAWHYCHASRILDVNVVRYYEPRDRVITIHRAARRLDARATIGGAQVVVGPSPARLREHRVVARAVRPEPRVIGRLSESESRTAVVRARERLPAVEQQNRRRIEGNVRVRDVARQHERDAGRLRVQPAPGRAPTPSPGPDRPIERERDRDRVREPAREPVRAQPQPDRARPQPPERAQPQPERTRPQPERAQPQPERTRPQPERAQPQPERARPQPPRPDQRSDRAPPAREPERRGPPPRDKDKDKDKDKDRDKRD